MDARTFRIAGREMVDYVADYLETLEKRDVVPDIQPGDVFQSIPVSPPEVIALWARIVKNTE